MIYFGKNLAFLRAKKGLTLEVMSELVGFGRSQWNNYEKETSFPKFLDLIQISKYFDISESDLIHKNLELDVITKPLSIKQKDFDVSHELLILQKEKIESLEKELSELKYTQRDPILYRTVAEPAPELIKKQPK